MPPRCWLAQSDGAHGGLTSPPSMRKFQRVSNLPASPSRWTLVQYGTGPMSTLGQKQTYAVQNGMSALPPKADMCGARVMLLLLIGRERLQKSDELCSALGRWQTTVGLHGVAGHYFVGVRDEALKVLFIPNEVCALHGAGI